MDDWPIGLSTGCFYWDSIFNVLEIIRDSGFSTIEICSSPAHLDYHDMDSVKRASDMIKQIGLQPFSFHAPFGENIDVSSKNSDQRRESLHEIMVAADAAAALNVKYFVIHPGPEKTQKPPPQEFLQNLTNAAEAFDKLASHCRAAEMYLILENMLPHLLFGHTSDLLWIIGALSHTNVGTCLDTGHANLSGDLSTVLFKLSGHLKMLHASDNKGKTDDHLPPGKGHINWKQLISKLSSLNFNGAMILELSGETKKSHQQIMQDANEARDYLTEIRRQISMSILQ
jgi:sugar phosphate isomerase/epimerase